jgi:energy-coupling factor transporter ATP-binding protein EcfA2
MQFVPMTVHSVRTQIIGLLGRSRSGKDTVADMLCGLLKPTPFERIYIAEPLKEGMRALYDFNHLHLYGCLKDVTDPRFDMTPREVCSKWSGFVRDIHGHDFFVRRLFERYDSQTIKPHWIVSDVRYDHDCEAIRKRGGIIWKITRSPMPLNVPGEEHIDHMACDAHIHNTKDIASLRAEVTRLLAKTQQTHLA